ncbi:MAG: hypothetical protein EP343_15175 [Deltaproteobacteria bacterium]|nr:MAG: hypothetical protein EP343_15175 [Deltaproteobacteria bacterium]
MQVKLTLKPGQPGTVRLTKQYGERLIAVRYRYDKASQKRYKTVELIVETIEWNQDKDTQVIEESLSTTEETNDANFDDLNEEDNEWQDASLPEKDSFVPEETGETQPQPTPPSIERSPTPLDVPAEASQDATRTQPALHPKGNLPDLSDIIDVSPFPKTPQPPPEAPPEKREPQAMKPTPQEQERIVYIRIKREEWELMELLESHGGHFSQEHKAWRASVALLHKLGLANRIR